MKKILIYLVVAVCFFTGISNIIKEDEGKTSKSVSDLKNDYNLYDNTPMGFGFKKEKKGVVPSLGSYQKFMGKDNVYYVGDTNKKMIYLTFDEGYENGYTAKILDVLKECSVPATFFCTGDYLKRNENLVKRMINEGHEIGNHTWNHKSMPKITDDEEFISELKKIDDFLYEKYKVKTKYFRYPEGVFSERTIKKINDMGYKTIFWSVAYKDWDRNAKNGIIYARDNVVNHIHNGAIILLHAVSEDNANALKGIIERLKDEGYIFSNINNI